MNQKSLYPGIVGLLALCFLQSCSGGDHGEKFKKIFWLIGSWKAEEKGYNYFERWKQESDSLLSGNGFVLKNGDTVFHESLFIILNDSGVFYSAEVGALANGKPINFKLNEKNDHESEFIFTNPGNEFPRHVIYSKTSENSFISAIDGGEGKDLKRRELSYSKTD